MQVKMSRQKLRESRIMAMQVLYHYDLMGNIDLDITDVMEQEQSDFSRKIISGVIEKKEEIDQIIVNSLTNYSIDRLSYVDRALCRAATFELISKTPINIVINETLEIVKEYSDLGDGKNKRFVHSLVDRINKTLNGN